ncbi:unnamed protein product [Owenia fusiformis]|uniref:Uncharacterized protein n=1 Tax=Owenia fusiformis TaxID=6347 RepID=A0A8J1UEB8_OWEFU|nr:unnamed protein product [Owenia fusiformis]
MFLVDIIIKNILRFLSFLFPRNSNHEDNKEENNGEERTKVKEMEILQVTTDLTHHPEDVALRMRLWELYTETGRMKEITNNGQKVKACKDISNWNEILGEVFEGYNVEKWQKNCLFHMQHLALAALKSKTALTLHEQQNAIKKSTRALKSFDQCLASKQNLSESHWPAYWQPFLNEMKAQLLFNGGTLLLRRAKGYEMNWSVPMASVCYLAAGVIGPVNCQEDWYTSASEQHKRLFKSLYDGSCDRQRLAGYLVQSMHKGEPKEWIQRIAKNITSKQDHQRLYSKVFYEAPTAETSEKSSFMASSRLKNFYADVTNPDRLGEYEQLANAQVVSDDLRFVGLFGLQGALDNIKARQESKDTHTESTSTNHDALIKLFVDCTKQMSDTQQQIIKEVKEIRMEIEAFRGELRSYFNENSMRNFGSPCAPGGKMHTTVPQGQFQTHDENILPQGAEPKPQGTYARFQSVQTQPEFQLQVAKPLPQGPDVQLQGAEPQPQNVNPHHHSTQIQPHCPEPQPHQGAQSLPQVGQHLSHENFDCKDGTLKNHSIENVSPAGTESKTTHGDSLNKHQQENGSWECTECHSRNEPNLMTCSACETVKTCETSPHFDQSHLSLDSVPSGETRGSDQVVSFEKSEMNSTSGFSFGTKEGCTGFSFNMTPTSSTSFDSCETQTKSPMVTAKPIVPLPDKVEVKTGEENEDIIFVHRAKLFRYADSEWKERGIGDIKILQHKLLKKSRVLMRREKILKICCNHRITETLELTPMSKADGKGLVWSTMDYSEGEPKREIFGVKFKTADIATKFKDSFDKAKTNRSEIKSVDISQDLNWVTSSQPKAESKPVKDDEENDDGHCKYEEKNDKIADHENDGNKDNDDEANDDFEAYHESDPNILFDEEVTLFIIDENKETQSIGQGSLVVLHDEEYSGSRVTMQGDNDSVLCNHLVATETRIHRNQRFCEWEAIDFATNSPIRRTFGADFNSENSAEEFEKVVIEGKESANKSGIFERDIGCAMPREVDFPEDGLEGEGGCDGIPTSTEAPHCLGYQGCDDEDSIDLNTVIELGPEAKNQTAEGNNGEHCNNEDYDDKVCNGTNDGNDNSVDDDTDDDYETDEGDQSIMLEKQVTLSIIDENNDAQIIGRGSVVVLHDEKYSGSRVTMQGDNDSVLCNHLVASETRIQRNPMESICEWEAIDFATNQPIRRTFRADFNSKNAAEEFEKIIIEGKESANLSGISERDIVCAMPREIDFQEAGGESDHDVNEADDDEFHDASASIDDVMDINEQNNDDKDADEFNDDNREVIIEETMTVDVTGDMENLDDAKKLHVGQVAISQPEAAGSKITNNDEQNDDEQINDENEDDEAAGGYKDDHGDKIENDDDEQKILFQKQVTLSTIDGCNQPQRLGSGELIVVHDGEFLGARVTMHGEDGNIMCNHLVATETRIQRNCKKKKKYCEWEAIDFATNQPIRLTLRAQFSSKSDAEEFEKIIIQGKKLASESGIYETDISCAMPGEITEAEPKEEINGPHNTTPSQPETDPK